MTAGERIRWTADYNRQDVGTLNRRDLDERLRQGIRYMPMYQMRMKGKGKSQT